MAKMMGRNLKKRRAPVPYSTFADDLDGAGPTEYGRSAEARDWKREAEKEAAHRTDGDD